MTSLSLMAGRTVAEHVFSHVYQARLEFTANTL